jgi:KUP system potassium uptake protein
VRLNFGQRAKIKYQSKGGNYVFFNKLVCFVLWLCVGIVLHFEESGKYGTCLWFSHYFMHVIMTTILLNFYLIMKELNYALSLA